MDVKKTLNSLLVTAFQDVLDIEEKTLITGEFTDITMNDMHVIEAIGDGEPKTSSTVAKQLSVTMGTLTKAIDRLTKNNYVLRERSETDKRLVLLSLKEKGKNCIDIITILPYKQIKQPQELWFVNKILYLCIGKSEIGN